MIFLSQKKPLDVTFETNGIFILVVTQPKNSYTAAIMCSIIMFSELTPEREIDNYKYFRL